MKIEEELAIERIALVKRGCVKWIEGAYDLAIKALEKQVPTPPENKVSEKYPSLGKNYYCKCGVMFIDWENYPTNYCGNCGQKLREVKD